MIDIGTNSVKLLVAEVEGCVVHPVWEDSNQTRLGRDFYDSHRLQSAAISHTAQAVAEFAATARSYRAQSTRLIATSAARDALNQQELVQAVEQKAGLRLEVISGEQEAEWAYQGVTTDPAFAGRRLLIIDAGGGSTEFILGEGHHPTFQQSFPIGAVRLLEKFKPSDPPAPAELQHCRNWLREFMEQQVQPLLGPALAVGKDRTWLVGTGGTAAILARMELSLDDYDRDRIEAARLSAAAISQWMDDLWSQRLAERKRILGLPKARADVILTGAAIYEALVRQFGFAELRVSTRGLRFAAVLPAAGEPEATKPSRKSDAP